MRILKIFGIVVAVHMAAFMFVFAIPGCRSTSHHASSRPNPADTVPAGNPYSDPNPVSGGSLDPVAQGGSAIVFPGNPAARSNPTRPGTPVADALVTPPVTDVVPAKAYKVVSRDSLWTVAKKHGLSESDLAAANHLRSGAPLRVGQKLIIPAKQLPPAIDSTALSAQTFSYKVQAGETLAQIAKRAGTTAASLKALNRLTSDHLHAGQELVLPSAPAAAATAAKATTETPDAAKTASKPLKNGALRHTVKPGESLGGIAKKYGVPLRDIATANHIANPASLRAGTELVIPQAKTGTAAIPTPTSSSTTSPSPAKQDAPAVEASPISPIGPANDANPISAPSTDSNPISAPSDGLISPAKE